MSDSNREAQTFVLCIVIVHWLFGLCCFIVGFTSWKFVAVGATAWIFCALVLIAAALDEHL